MHTDRLISQIVELMKGSKEIIFDTAVEVKLTPHIHLCSVWGVMVGISKDVWLMTADEKWSVLKPNDQNANEVAMSVLQRLKLIKSKAIA